MRLTQTERLLRALRQRGDQGVTAVDFLLPDVIDGGKPITRLAARVLDARADGNDIVSFNDSGPHLRYKLAPVVSSGREPGTDPASPARHLSPPAHRSRPDETPEGVQPAPQPRVERASEPIDPAGAGQLFVLSPYDHVDAAA